MTPEAQRISIAEALGWSSIHNANTMSPSGIWKGYHPRIHIIGSPENLPDFLNDLNAVADARKQLLTSSTLKEAFTLHLYHVVLCFPADIEVPICWSYLLIDATAAQQCEALLRTIELWKDLA